MPDERRYDDAELDEVGLVRSGQSGNLDRGHIDARISELTGEQGQDLNTIAQHYLTGTTNYNELQEQLRDEGYSESQIQTLGNAFHAERVYRYAHDGTPSNLAPNQITYLYDNFGNQLSSIFIQHDANGNPTGYTSPMVGREEGGGPIVAPLPVAIPLQVLTDAQQEEIEQLRQLQPILDEHLQNQPAPVRTRDELNSFDRLQIDEALTHYFSGQTDIVGLTTELSTMIGIQEVNNNEQILGQIIEDAIYEKEYRALNGGRPRVLSQEQYDYIRQNPLQQYYQVLSGQRGTFEYTGQPIYVIPGTNTFYIRTQIGRILVPTFNEDGTLADPDISAQEVGYLLPRVVLDPSNVPDSEIGISTGDGIRPNRPENLNNDKQLLLERYTALLLNNDLTFDGYLELVDGQFNLNQQQYEALVISVLNNDRMENIPRDQADKILYYSDRPLFLKQRDNGSYVVFNQINYTTLLESEGRTQQEIDEIINPVVVRFDRAHEVRLYNDVVRPTLTPSTGGGGVDRLLAGLNRGSLAPAEIVNAYENLPPVSTQSDPVTGLNINDDLPTPEIDSSYTPQPTITPSGPSATGLGEPHERIDTSRFQPTLEENVKIRGYENYYERNQSLYAGFREEFKNVLPAVSGLIGGGIAFSFFRARDRGYMGQVLRQNRLLVDLLLAKLEDEAKRLSTAITRQEQRTRDLETAREDYRQTQEIFGTQPIPIVEQQDPLGVAQLRNFLPPELRNEIQAGTQQIVATDLFENEIQEIRNIEDELQILHQDIDRLENEIVDSTTDRQRLNEEFTEIINTDYSILQEIQQNLPQILQGFTIGMALGQVLAGYVFPTAIDEDQPLIVDSTTIESNKNKKTEFKKSESLSSHLPTEHKEKMNEKPILTGPVEKPYRDYEHFDSNLRGFTMKYNRSKGRPLNSKELNEIKSILSKEELARFEGKNIFFNPKGKLETMDGGKCMSYIKKPITGIDYNNNMNY